MTTTTHAQALPFALVLAASLATACGGAAPQTGTTAHPVGNDSSANPPPSGEQDYRTRARLGHFATEDGSDGFVLDLLAEPALFRRDGSSEIVRLTREGSVSGAYELRNDEKNVWLRVYDEGWEAGRVLYDGPDQHEGVGTVRDRNAEPLPR